jgi:hypothetical protein
VAHHATAPHIQADINHAPHQMSAGLDDRRVESITPKRSGPFLASILSLGELPFEHLYEPADLIGAFGSGQQMDMIAGWQ